MTRPPAGPTPDLVRLRRDLRAAMSGEVRFDPGHRALYATDASNYRQVPIGVVLPRTPADVVAAVEVCRRHDVPMLPRGAGTSLAGQACNVAVVLDCSRHLGAVLDVDSAARTAVVQPGAVLDALRAAAAPHGLTFGPDPATHDRCTLGGMIGNNACGVHSLYAGTTADNVVALDVLTYRGERLVADRRTSGPLADAARDLAARVAPLVRERFPTLRRRVSGYNLDRLLPEQGGDLAAALVGTEGTCVTVVEATLRLVPALPARVLVVVGYPDLPSAADDVPRVLDHGPIGLEGLDATVVADMVATGRLADPGGLPGGGAWLLVEFGADDPRAAEAAASRFVRRTAAALVVADPARAARLWAAREAAVGAVARAPGRAPTWPGWEDAAVPPERLGAYLREFADLLAGAGYTAACYGHFGEGCVHARIDFDFGTGVGTRRFRDFVVAAADLVVRHGGSLSGEHGDGQARGELLERMYGPELVVAFREFKAIWDPDGRMNPGKVVDARPVDADLRLGPTYRPREPRTWFAYPADGGSLAHAVERCVGVGACRRTEGGTMCPSYRVTGEERHSTRGRAHLLFELLSGAELAGFRDEQVHEALDLCLACKACRRECPAGVDVATYKSEFLARHHRHHRRSVREALVARIDLLARAGSRAPQVADALTAAASLPAVRRALGLAPRPLPRLARRRLAARANPPAVDGRPVVLWVDTFTEHFRPEVGDAAVAVLGRLGWAVAPTPPGLCCGRPRYDAGLLSAARGRLRGVVAALAPAAAAGVPIVGLEPGCLSVLRDELPALLPDDPAAAAVAGAATTLGELVDRSGGELPTLPADALVHGHCHHVAVLDHAADVRVLRRLGVTARVLDSGCCGLAGGFGYAAARHDVATALGERVLFPAVRAAGSREMIVTDGFSCAQQIAWGTGRRATHLAEVLARAYGVPVGAAWEGADA